MSREMLENMGPLEPMGGSSAPPVRRDGGKLRLLRFATLWSAREAEGWTISRTCVPGAEDHLFVQPPASHRAAREHWASVWTPIALGPVRLLVPQLYWTDEPQGRP